MNLQKIFEKIGFKAFNNYKPVADEEYHFKHYDLIIKKTNGDENMTKEKHCCKCTQEGWNLPFGFYWLSFFGLLAIIVWVMASPMDFEAQCEFDNWKELPNGEVWNNPLDSTEYMTMYPDHSECKFKGKIPITIINKITG